MANELRKLQNFVGGLVEDNPLTAAATTVNSAGLAVIAGGISSSEHMPIVLDPDGIGGAPEIAYITALTAGTGAATIARGQEGTTAREHNRDTPWVASITALDLAGGGTPRTARVDTTETTTSTSYTDLATSGPAVSVLVGPSGLAMVHISANIDNSSAIGIAGFAISGASTVAAADAYAMSSQGTDAMEFGRAFLITGLTAGVNTFTMKYRATAGTAEFARRVIIVEPK